VGYAGRAILPPIELEVGPGELWAVIGRNGCGKTTWLRTVAGLVEPLGGSVVRRPGLRVTYLPQRARLDELYPLRAKDVVRMGLERGRSFLGFSRGSDERVKAALDRMGALALGDERFDGLSEGQKQRVLFARLAASGADLALLDEPTSAMDVVAEREALTALGRLAESGMAIVVVSHYLRLAEELADGVLFLDRDGGSVVAGTPGEVFAHAAFRARYAATAEGALG
jgi:zinc transport system ATP-binding protein